MVAIDAIYSEKLIGSYKLFVYCCKERQQDGKLQLTKCSAKLSWSEKPVVYSCKEWQQEGKFVLCILMSRSRVKACMICLRSLFAVSVIDSLA